MAIGIAVYQNEKAKTRAAEKLARIVVNSKNVEKTAQLFASTNTQVVVNDHTWSNGKTSQVVDINIRITNNLDGVQVCAVQVSAYRKNGAGIVIIEKCNRPTKFKIADLLTRKVSNRDTALNRLYLEG